MAQTGLWPRPKASDIAFPGNIETAPSNSPGDGFCHDSAKALRNIG
jgi:hypothetical protein